MTEECGLSLFSSWNGEAIKKQLRRLVDDLGYVPPSTEYQELSTGEPTLPSLTTLSTAYGGYPASIRAAGINPKAVHGDVDEALDQARRAEQ